MTEKEEYKETKDAYIKRALAKVNYLYNESPLEPGEIYRILGNIRANLNSALALTEPPQD
jgi:hypothetical protein